MKNKFLFFIAAVMAVIFIVTGCASDFDYKKADVDTSVSDAPYSNARIGICIYQLNDDFMSLFSEEMVNYLVSLGFSKDNIIVLGSSNNQAIQLSQVEELVEKKVDVMIVNPVNASIVNSITEQAVANDIPLVYINREPSAEEESNWEEYDLDVTYVGCDARQSGIYQGELLIDFGVDKLDLNKDGALQYYMIEGAPENIDAGFRTMYSVSTLENAGIKMDCLLDEVGNWDMATAKLIVAKGLSQGLVPEVILCNNDAMALGTMEAIKEADLVPGKDIYVAGVDALPEALQEVKNGGLIGTVFNDYISQSHSAVDAALKYLAGEKNEHYIGCEYVKVNSQNAEDIIKEMGSNTAVEKREDD